METIPASTEPETIEGTVTTPPSIEAVTQAQLRSLQADSTITKHVALATGTGFIPVPVFDIVATTGVQADLLIQLFKIYGHHISKEKARSIVTVLLGASLPTLAARTVASGLKMIPAVGTALGFFTSPTLAGTSTYIVGRVIEEHLATGGSPFNLHLAEASAKVKQELSKIKTKSGDLIVESKERVGNAVAALRGKKAEAVPAQEDAAAAI
jgi:uncharacterized protein (DUF697 family)